MMWGKKRNDYFNIDDDNKPSEAADHDTRQFDLDGVQREPAEKCEERGSVRDYTLSDLLWRVLKPALIFAVSAALVIFLGIKAFDYVKGSYFDPVSGGSGVFKSVQIKAGSSLSTIAGALYDDGIIRNKFVFQVYVDFKDMGSKLQAGTYNLSPAMTIDDIISVLAAGNEAKQVVKVTLTEGMTTEDMAAVFVNKGIFNADEKQQFLELCNDSDAFSDYAFIKAVAGTADLTQRRFILEGYLFPDTYEFYTDATPEDVIRKMLDRFNQIFTVEYQDKAKNIGMSADQVMTLASIIEWEALPQDFGKVSAVFHNRLSSGMKLQSEATVRYVLGKKPPYTAVEANTDSPYNTNVVPALPIGPICNPGLKSIEAALSPDADYVAQKYLYFCNKDLAGDLAFAKTPKEQSANLAAYNALVAAQASALPTASPNDSAAH